MRKKAFSKYVKRLALLTDHPRLMLVQALAAHSAGEVTGNWARWPSTRRLPVLPGNR